MKKNKLVILKELDKKGFRPMTQDELDMFLDTKERSMVETTKQEIWNECITKAKILLMALGILFYLYLVITSYSELQTLRLTHTHTYIFVTYTISLIGFIPLLYLFYGFYSSVVSNLLGE